MDAANPYSPPQAGGPPDPTTVPERIRIVADITAADQAIMERRLIARWSKPGGLRPWMRIVVIVMVVFTVAFMCVMGSRFGIFMAGAWTMLAWLLLMQRLARKRLARVRAENPFLGTRTFDLGPEGLEMASAGFLQRINWTFIRYVLVAPDAIYLLYSPIAGWWIPTAALHECQRTRTLPH